MCLPILRVSKALQFVGTFLSLYVLACLTHWLLVSLSFPKNNHMNILPTVWFLKSKKFIVHGSYIDCLRELKSRNVINVGHKILNIDDIPTQSSHSSKNQLMKWEYSFFNFRILFFRRSFCLNFFLWSLAFRFRWCSCASFLILLFRRKLHCFRWGLRKPTKSSVLFCLKSDLEWTVQFLEKNFLSLQNSLQVWRIVEPIGFEMPL